MKKSLIVRMIWPVKSGEDSVMFLVDHEAIGRRWLRAHGNDARFLKWISGPMNVMMQGTTETWIPVTAEVGDEIACDVMPDLSAEFPLLEEAMVWYVMEA